MNLIQFSSILIFLILLYEAYSFIKRYPVYCFDFEVFGQVLDCNDTASFGPIISGLGNASRLPNKSIGFKETLKKNSLAWEIRGFAQDTRNNSVHGYIEVPANRMNSIKEWLSKKGPPGAVIENAVFKNQKKLGEYTYKVFHTLLTE